LTFFDLESDIKFNFGSLRSKIINRTNDCDRGYKTTNI